MVMSKVIKKIHVKNKEQGKSNSSEMIDLMKDFITQQQVDKEQQRQEHSE